MSGVAFAAVVPVGPTRAEVVRVWDLLESLRFYEPDVAAVVLVDDELGRLRELTLPVRATGRVCVVDNPRRGRGVGLFGGLCAGVVAGLAWVQAHTDAQLVVKLDTDSLVIAPFAAALAAAFASHPDVGQLGAFDMSCTGKPRHAPKVFANAFAMHRRLAAVTSRPGGRREVHVAAWGWRRRLRRQIRAARAHGYVDGEHCQGGAYALSRTALDRMASAGYLRRPCTWLETSLPEDGLISMLVHATGLRCASLVGRGEPFGDGYRGLPFAPWELAERGHSLVHSVKNDPRFPEAEVRAYFSGRRAHDLAVR
jgi:hypothetical protein